MVDCSFRTPPLVWSNLHLSLFLHPLEYCHIPGQLSLHLLNALIDRGTGGFAGGAIGVWVEAVGAALAEVGV